MKMASTMTFSLADKHSDIIFAELNAPVKIDLEGAIEMVANRLAFTENEKHYLVFDASKVRGITAEAKNFLQKPDGGLKNILGAAFIASNPVSALFANIFMKTPTDFQAKFFSCKHDALDWIYSQRLKAAKVNPIKS